ncbi:hypothetical protein BDN72DRAFT_856481 [Pluteus cervinus]|uniref:Uncharacterized protein n=1 Tax=Pluteus cervinus TaxID=181527 RepID=A0ACD3B1I7_9AGAR|nr:hypothetical protein BDN72DRAFT_856481 [Pluteus cervinus]
MPTIFVKDFNEINWEKVVLEPDKHAICPACLERTNCGPSGIENMKKQHTLKGSCRKMIAKKEKIEQDAARKLKDGSLLPFFRTKPAKVPSTVNTAAPIHGDPVARVKRAVNTLGPAVAPPRFPFVDGIGLIERLKHLTRDLPDHIPEATDNDTLAMFSGIPPECDDLEVDSQDLWEVILNPFMKAVLGWGIETDMTQLIRRGKKGMGAVLEFVRYFVEKRGVDVELFEGKLANLVESAERLVITGSDNEAYRAQELLLDVEAIETTHPTPDEAALGVGSDSELEIVLHRTAKMGPTYSKCCAGYHLDFPEGKSPYSAYPSALHDVIFIPWSYKINGGIMTLHAGGCPDKSFLSGDQDSCSLCRQLPRNAVLQGIKDRLNDGVHENAQWEYHGVSGLRTLLQQKNEKIEFYRLRSLNHARALLAKATALSEYKRFIVAIASGKVESIDRVIRVGLSQNRGIRGILAMYEDAARGVYHPRGWTEEQDMRALLLFKLGGNRIAHINHRAHGDPSVTYLRSRSTIPPLIPSHGQPTTFQVSRNVRSVFKDVVETIHKHVDIVHAVLMFDELATEKRIRWDHGTNQLLGSCREHGSRVSLEFTDVEVVEELFKALDNGQVHYAAEATIAALGILTENHRIYPARAILVSGDCKRETGEEHASLVQTVLDGVEAEKPTTKIRIVSVASDGESRRGLAFSLLTFKYTLSPQSPLFALLAHLIFMNLRVGANDLTCDKDCKHIIKRFRNLLLPLLRSHLVSDGIPLDRIRVLFKPDDTQDVPTAFELLKDIWISPHTSDNDKPELETSTREALWVFGKFLYHLIFPYICVDFTLSEQLEHLSAAAHLALILYRSGRKAFLPTDLYVDVMLMIKNVYFCVAKAKVDNPTGSFWIVLLGTDRLEELFGILRTMVGNDANSDILQLVSRLGGTTEVANILAQYPHWDRGPQRLKIPAMTRDSQELPAGTDHIKPGSWRGDVRVYNVSPQTAWRRGRSLIEDECDFASPILSQLDNDPTVDILSPFGVLLPTSPPLADDVDESLDDVALAAQEPSDPQHDDNNSIVQGSSDLRHEENERRIIEIDNRIEVENALTEASAEDTGPTPSTDLVIPPTGASRAVQSPPFAQFLVVNGKELVKSRILSQYGKYRRSTTSTDRLRRVQEVERYVSTHSAAKSHRQPSGSPDDINLVMFDPIVSLLCCDGHAWLVVGQVNGLKIDGEPVDVLSHSLLSEPTVVVSYQALGLKSASLEDDPDGENDWRSCQLSAEHTYTVPGGLIQQINPSLSPPKPSTRTRYYLLDSRDLVALSASLFERLVVADLKRVPKIAAESDFPYREGSGKACFICDDNGVMEHLGKGDLVDCPLCSFNLDLAQGQRVLEHISAHILFDPRVDRATDPCGLCLLSAATCRYFLKKGRGAKAGLKIDTDRSHGCILIKCSFSYRVAAKSSPSSPSSNIPLACPLCPKAAPAVWRYNLERHLRTVHPSVDSKGDAYHKLYKLDPSEAEGMKNIWVRREKQVVKRVKKLDTTPLVVSEAHRTRINVSLNTSKSSNREVDSNNDNDEEGEESNVNGLKERVDETLNIDNHSSVLTDNINQTSASTSQDPTALQVNEVYSDSFRLIPTFAVTHSFA